MALKTHIDNVFYFNFLIRIIVSLFLIRKYEYQRINELIRSDKNATDGQTSIAEEKKKRWKNINLI